MKKITLILLIILSTSLLNQVFSQQGIILRLADTQVNSAVISRPSGRNINSNRRYIRKCSVHAMTKVQMPFVTVDLVYPAMHNSQGENLKKSSSNSNNYSRSSTKRSS